jgi:hypothetical protein
MKRLGALGRFLWDFVVGDDWLVAAGIALALALTAALAATSVPAWWLLPLGVALVLWASLRRATARAASAPGRA